MRLFLRKYTSLTGKENKFWCTLLLGFFLFPACASGHEPAVKAEPAVSEETQAVPEVQTGAERLTEYLPLLEKKRVAVIANQTSLVKGVHLVDTLHSLGVNIVKVFALEHGFRGEAEAGAHINNEKDPRTGIPIVSIYGNNKKPKPTMLQDVDLLLFDIQDVGARFYTYISSLHYLMEAAAENGKLLVVLDRPNPNGFYVDGPVLDMKHKSFVGMHPVPVVHGMTVGEYAQMINGQGWLASGVTCALKVITCLNYTHSTLYELPVNPSPNLVNMTSIYLYPSLCIFEGTTVSIGRGTPYPFQVVGMPEFKKGEFTFTPVSVPAAKNPPHKDLLCTGYDLRGEEKKILETKKLNLSWLIEFYQNAPDKQTFFEKSNMFTLLSGSELLKKQLQQGLDEEAIRASWEPALSEFKKMRASYLLYPE